MRTSTLALHLHHRTAPTCPFHCPAFFFHRSISARLARLQPFFIKSCCSSSSALARLLTSTQRQTLRKALSSLLNLFGFFRRGVPFVAMRNKAFSGSSFKYGGSDSIISIAMIPRDQMSTLGPYSFCLTTSGAIQYGVPTIVARLLFCSVSLAQKPKSAIQSVSRISSKQEWQCPQHLLILTFPRRSSRTLSLLMSRWMISWL